MSVRHRIPNDHSSSIVQLEFDDTGKFIVSVGADGLLLVNDTSLLRTILHEYLPYTASSVTWLSSLLTGVVACGLENGLVMLHAFPTTYSADLVSFFPLAILVFY